jgi:hypothetical protein
MWPGRRFPAVFLEYHLRSIRDRSRSISRRSFEEEKQIIDSRERTCLIATISPVDFSIALYTVPKLPPADNNSLVSKMPIAIFWRLVTTHFPAPPSSDTDWPYLPPWLRDATRVVAQGGGRIRGRYAKYNNNNERDTQLVQLNQQFLPLQGSMADLDKSSTLKTPSDQKTAN